MAMFAAKFVADGWGGSAGRVLDLSTWEGQSRDEQVAGSDWGFYAQNGAELKLFTVFRNTPFTGVGDKVFHEGALMDKINGFGVKHASAPPAGVFVTGSVLALDHPSGRHARAVLAHGTHESNRRTAVPAGARDSRRSVGHVGSR